MKKIKLIGIDLDGTLISKFKKISKKNVLSIKKAIDNGISCAIITGRSIVSSKKIKDELDFKTQSIGRFLVSFNGSSIIDFYENKTYETFIDSKIAKEIYDLALQWKLNSWYYTKEATLKGAVEVEGYKPFLLTKIFKNLNLKKVTNPNKLSSYKINILSFSKRKISNIYKLLTDKYKGKLNFSLSHKRLIEITPKGIDKGYAINFIQKKLNILPDETAYFGDSMNDYPAFKQSRVKFLVKSNKKALTEQATYIIDTKQDAVAYGIDKFILNKQNKKVKLLASDLDGTLLDNELKIILPEVKKAIKDNVDCSNLYFAIATGRNLDDIDLILNSIDIKNKYRLFAISNNGSSLYDYKTNSYLFNNTLKPLEVYKLMLEIIKIHKTQKYGKIAFYLHLIQDPQQIKNKIVQKLYCYNLPFVKERLSKMSPNMIKHSWAKKEFVEIKSYKNIKDVNKIVLFTQSQESSQEIRDYLVKTFPSFNITCSSKLNVEINTNNSSKGYALNFLCKYLNISPNETIAVGDEENDISMLKLSGHSVTLSTSKEIVVKSAKHCFNLPPSKIVKKALEEIK